jgi:hypothetical protein
VILRRPCAAAVTLVQFFCFNSFRQHFSTSAGENDHHKASQMYKPPTAGSAHILAALELDYFSLVGPVTHVTQDFTPFGGGSNHIRQQERMRANQVDTDTTLLAHKDVNLLPVPVLDEAKSPAVLSHRVRDPLCYWTSVRTSAPPVNVRLKQIRGQICLRGQLGAAKTISALWDWFFLTG